MSEASRKQIATEGILGVSLGFRPWVAYYLYLADTFLSTGEWLPNEGVFHNSRRYSFPWISTEYLDRISR